MTLADQPDRDDEPPLADQPARDQIRSELHENLFVDAGAGTGKTSALVDRVVGSVMVDGVPHQVEHSRAGA